MAIEDKLSQTSDQAEDQMDKGFFNRQRAGGKTTWDWLNLLGVLAIPLVVVGATIAFGFLQIHLADLQHQSDQKIAQQQHDNDQKIAQQQYQANLQNSLDQQHTTILQNYFTNLQDLMFNHNLLNATSTDDVAIIARAETLTALQRLGSDVTSKKSLVLFLYEAGLIKVWDSKGMHGTIIDLHYVVGEEPHMEHSPYYPNLSLFADLSGADLHDLPIAGIDLSGVELSNSRFDGAYLIYANLSDAILEGANLAGAELGSADLAGADLEGADLSEADLAGANLAGAYLGRGLSGDPHNHGIKVLPDAIITQQQLDEVSSCQGAILPQGLTCHNQ